MPSHLDSLVALMPFGKQIGMTLTEAGPAAVQPRNPRRCSNGVT
jgi:hypothetical protein